MDILKNELLAGFKIFGTDNKNDECIEYWKEYCNLTDEQVEELREYNRKISELPEYQE